MNPLVVRSFHFVTACLWYLGILALLAMVIGGILLNEAQGSGGYRRGGYSYQYYYPQQYYYPTYYYPRYYYPQTYYYPQQYYYPQVHCPTTEKVVVKEVAVAKDVPQLGSTQYGYSVKDQSVLDQYPPTSLGELLRDKGADVYAAGAHELAKTAAYTAATSRELSINGQQLLRERQQFEFEARKLALQGAIVENVVVKSFQNIGALGGTQALVNQGALTEAGANGLVGILQAKCIECHGGKKIEGGVDFTDPSALSTRTWARAYRMTLTGKMPPPESGIEPITNEELTHFEAALEVR